MCLSVDVDFDGGVPSDVLLYGMKHAKILDNLTDVHRNVGHVVRNAITAAIWARMNREICEPTWDISLWHLMAMYNRGRAVPWTRT